MREINGAQFEYCLTVNGRTVSNVFCPPPRSILIKALRWANASSTWSLFNSVVIRDPFVCVGDEVRG